MKNQAKEDNEELEAIDLHKIFSSPSLHEPKKEEHSVPKSRNIFLITVFSIITLGIYNDFWYSKRAPEFNNLETKKKMSRFVPRLTVAIGVASVFSLIAFILSLSPEQMGTFYQNTSTLQTIFLIVFLAGSILRLTLSLFLSFHSRSIINEAIKYNKNAEKKISGILTLIFGSIYLQYEINRIVDDEEENPIVGPWIALAIVVLWLAGLIFFGIM